MIWDDLKRRWSRVDTDTFAFEMPDGWTQGRTVYGGMTAASAAALAETLTDRPLRTMQCALLGPMTPGAVRGDARVLREGKTTTFIEVALSQESKLRARFSFVAISARRSSIEVTAPPAPEWNAPDDYSAMPYFEGASPAFTQHVDFRFTEGTLPFTSGTEAHIGGYIRLVETPKTSSAPWQLALLDAWPAPTLSLLSHPVPASTVTWSAHLLQPSSTAGYHRFVYDAVVARAGFSTLVGHLWDSRGTYVGFTEQTAVTFD